MRISAKLDNICIAFVSQIGICAEINRTARSCEQCFVCLFPTMMTKLRLVNKHSSMCDFSSNNLLDSSVSDARTKGYFILCDVQLHIQHSKTLKSLYSECGCFTVEIKMRDSVFSQFESN